MASLTKTKTLFGFTSPRTIEKIIPEIELLSGLFRGKKWSGNVQLQINFFEQLFNSEFYKGGKYPSDPALASRDRITRAPKALGFIDLKPIIALTEIGKVLLSEKRIEETITRQLLKFQLPSPYHTQSSKIEFNVKPYLELLHIINDLGSISKTEIALFFSQLTNINKYSFIIKKIKSFRINSKKYKGSRKMYVQQCFEEEILDIYSEEINNNNLKTRESNKNNLKKFIKTKSSNMKDYADSFSRYIRATELVTFQRRTFRLIISSQKKDEVKYILTNIDRKPLVFRTEKDFKSFMFSANNLKLLSDNKELLINRIKNLGYEKLDINVEIEELKDILHSLRQQIKKQNIETNKKELKNYNELPGIVEVFEQIRKKEIPDPPLFLEWNDTQYRMESESVPRHFGKTKELLGKEMYCVFVAPKISEGTLAHYFNLNKMNTKLYGGKTKIIPLSIEEFILFIKTGVEKHFNKPKRLKNWLENQWLINQSCNDEEIWKKSISENIVKWAES